MEKNNNQNNYSQINFSSPSGGAKPLSNKISLTSPSINRSRLTDKNKKLPGGKIIALLAVLFILVFVGKPILSFGISAGQNATGTSDNFSVNLNPASLTNTATTTTPQVLGDQISAVSSPASSTTAEQPTPVAANNQIITSIKVNNTPTGFLNVRNGPSLNKNIITKVYPGQTYSDIKDQAGWSEIILSSGKSGWVDGQYVTATYSKQ